MADFITKAQKMYDDMMLKAGKLMLYYHIGIWIYPGTKVIVT